LDKLRLRLNRWRLNILQSALGGAHLVHQPLLRGLFGELDRHHSCLLLPVMFFLLLDYQYKTASFRGICEQIAFKNMAQLLTVVPWTSSA
jgi:hypothetical protein